MGIEKREVLWGVHSTSNSENRLGVSVQYNPTSIQRAAKGDIEAAMKNPRLRGAQESVNIYTDGGTIPGDKPKTAWGLQLCNVM